MRLLLTADPFVPVPPKYYGGIERIIALLVEQLRERGHTVGLVAHPESDLPVDFLLGWPRTAPHSLSDHVDNVRQLRTAVAKFRPSIIHSFSRIAYLLPFLSSKITKVMSYQRLVSRHTVGVASRVAGRSLTFTGCSGYIADMGRQHGGTWHAIPNFVDTEFYGYSESVPADAPLVFLSRVERVKGTHIAIEVAKKTGRRLIIAGNHVDTGDEGSYWNECIKPELGHNGIEYVGPVDDAAKATLLKSAAAMIVPIQWDEPFGIVFAEALACGVPVISCPRGALPEIVRQGVDGFLVRSVGEACEAVHSLGQIDRRECRRRAETEFSASVVATRYESLYRSLVGVH